MPLIPSIWPFGIGCAERSSRLTGPAIPSTGAFTMKIRVFAAAASLTALLAALGGTVYGR